MAQGTGLPGDDPSSFNTIQPGPAPETAGAGWAASTAAIGQLNDLFGGAVNLAAAHEQVVDQANQSTARSGSDVDLTNLSNQHAQDPQGFMQAAQQLKTQVLAKTPGRYALQMGAYLDQSIASTYQKLSDQSAMRDHSLAMQANSDRLQTVTNTLSNEYSSGAPLAIAEQSPPVVSGTAEAQALIKTGVTGLYGPRTDANAANWDAAVAAKQADLSLNLRSSAFTGHVLQVAQTQGLPAALAEVQRLERAGVPITPTGQAPASVAGGAPATTSSQPALTPAPTPTGAAETSTAGEPSGSPTAAAAPATTQPTPASIGAWEAGVSVTPQEVASMVAQSRTALQQFASLQQQQSNLSAAARDQAQQAMTKAINDSTAAAEQTGKADPSITRAAVVASPLGLAGWNSYVKGVGDAIDRFNTHGDLSKYPTAQAAGEALSSIHDLAAVPKTISTDEDFDAAWAATKLTEHGLGPQGQPLMSHSGAMGVSQLTPGAARDAAKALGRNDLANLSDTELRGVLMSPDQSTNEMLGRQRYRMGLDAANGDPLKGYLAYHNGIAGMHSIVAKYGDIQAGDTSMGAFQGALRQDGYKETADAMGLFANAMQGGKAAAAYHSLQDQSGPYATSRTAFVADPLDWARTHGMAQVAPLNLNGYSATGAPAQQWSAALQSRAAAGTALATKYGVAPRILTNGEATSYHDMLNRDPTLAVTFANAATRALGAPGAAEFLREVGQGDQEIGVGLQTAWLQANGQTRMATSVQKGLDARAQNVPEPALPLVGGRKQTWEGIAAAYAPAFRMVPGSQAAIVATARAGYLGDTQGGVPDGPPSAYFNAAMGGRRNRSGDAFGGVAPVNGVPVVHPTWLRQGAFGDAMRAIGDQPDPNGPVFSNGQPMKGRDLAGMIPYVRPDGNYWLASPRTNQLARDRAGRPYELNLEGAKGWLEQHVPRVAGAGL